MEPYLERCTVVLADCLSKRRTTLKQTLPQAEAALAIYTLFNATVSHWRQQPEHVFFGCFLDVNSCLPLSNEFNQPVPLVIETPCVKDMMACHSSYDGSTEYFQNKRFRDLTRLKVMPVSDYYFCPELQSCFPVFGNYLDSFTKNAMQRHNAGVEMVEAQAAALNMTGKDQVFAMVSEKFSKSFNSKLKYPSDYCPKLWLKANSNLQQKQTMLNEFVLTYSKDVMLSLYTHLLSNPTSTELADNMYFVIAVWKQYLLRFGQNYTDDVLYNLHEDQGNSFWILLMTNPHYMTFMFERSDHLFKSTESFLTERFIIMNEMYPFSNYTVPKIVTPQPAIDFDFCDLEVVDSDPYNYRLPKCELIQKSNFYLFRQMHRQLFVRLVADEKNFPGADSFKDSNLRNKILNYFLEHYDVNDYLKKNPRVHEFPEPELLQRLLALNYDKIFTDFDPTEMLKYREFENVWIRCDIEVFKEYRAEETLNLNRVQDRLYAVDSHKEAVSVCKTMRQQINDVAKVVTIQFDPMEPLEQKKLQKAYKKSIFPDVEALFCDVIQSAKVPISYTTQQAEVFEAINVMVGPLLRTVQDTFTDNGNLKTAIFGIAYQAIYGIQNKCKINGYLKLAPLTQAIGQTLRLEDLLEKTSDDQCLCFSFTNITTTTNLCNSSTPTKDPACQNSTTSGGSTTPSTSSTGSTTTSTSPSGSTTTPTSPTGSTTTPTSPSGSTTTPTSPSGPTTTPTFPGGVKPTPVIPGGTTTPPNNPDGVTIPPAKDPPKVVSCAREAIIPDNMKQFWPEFQGNKTNKIGDVDFEIIYLNGADSFGNLWENSFDIQKLQAGETPDSNEQRQLTLYTPKFRGKLQTGAYLVEGNEVVNFIPKWEGIDSVKPSDVFIHWGNYIKIETYFGLYYMGDCPEGYSPIGVYQSLEDFNKDLHNCMKNSVSIELETGKDIRHFNSVTDSKIEMSFLGDIKSIVKMDGKDYFEDRVTYQLFMASQSHTVKDIEGRGGNVQVLSPVTLVIAHPTRVFTDTYLPFRMLYLDDYNFRDQIVRSITFNKKDTAKFGLIDFYELEQTYNTVYQHSENAIVQTFNIVPQVKKGEAPIKKDYLIFNVFSQSWSKAEREGTKFYAIPRTEYNTSTVFEEPLDFIEPAQLVKNNAVKYNNHYTILTEGKLPKIIIPVCPEGYYPVSYFLRGNIDAYKMNTIHCLKDEFIEFAPMDQPPQNGTQTCFGLDSKFVFPLIREGYNDTKVTYSIDFCSFYFVSQFTMIKGQRRQVQGGVLPTLFNLQASYQGVGKERYNVTAFQVKPFINLKNEKLRFYNDPYEVVFSKGYEVKEELTFNTMKIENLKLGTEFKHRSWKDAKNRGIVDGLARQIPAEPNRFYIPRDADRQNLTEAQLMDQDLYFEHFPIRQDQYLTFSSYVFGNLTGLEDRSVLVLSREQYKHTDLFTEPIRFRSWVDETGLVTERYYGAKDMFVYNGTCENPQSAYFPECPTGYFPISQFLNDGFDDKNSFAAYRENTLHCIKEEATIKISELGIPMFTYFDKFMWCEQQRRVIFDSFFISSQEDGYYGYQDRNEDTFRVCVSHQRHPVFDKFHQEVTESVELPVFPYMSKLFYSIAWPELRTINWSHEGLKIEEFKVQVQY